MGGLAWTAGAKLGTQVITWGSTIAVAHMLTRADYGTGEMAGMLYGVSNVAAEFGVGGAVVFIPELSDEALAQLHTFSALLCLGVFLIAVAVSPLMAAFYHSDLTLFFMATNVNLLLTGFQTVPMGMLGRDMDYRRLSIAEVALVLVQALVTLIAASLGWGYWSLMAGMTTGKLAAAILVCSWKHVGFAWPRWDVIKVPVRLGRQAAIGRIAWSVYTISDGIVVGRFLGSSALGVYRMAMNLASAPAEKVSTLLMRTATPLFAKVQGNMEEVRRYYLIILEVMSLLIMPLMSGLSMVADSAVKLIFGPEWAPVAGPLRWLAMFMIIRTASTLTEQVLNSQRLARFTMRMSLLNFFLMPAAFATAGIYFGSTGVAAAWAVFSPITVAPLIFKLSRVTGLKLRRVAGVLLPATMGTLAMCAALHVLRQWPQTAPTAPLWRSTPSLHLLFEIVVGAVVYGGLIMALFGARIVRYVRYFRQMKGS